MNFYTSSRAIMCYLADQYGNQNTKLYPKSIRARALVHQRMHFDASTLYTAISNYYVSIKQVKEIEG